MVARRAAGEPLEQVVGWAEFAGLRVLVDPGVFVPRRRSEFLVEVAVRLAARPDGYRPRRRSSTCAAAPARSGSRSRGRAGRGRRGRHRGGATWRSASTTGHGAGTAPGSLGVELHAADLDPAAVACARRNVEPAGGHVYAGDLFSALPDSLRGRIGVLICNAPYVPTAEIAFMPAEARDHEALMALDGGADGLAILRRAAAGAAGGSRRAARCSWRPASGRPRRWWPR